VSLDARSFLGRLTALLRSEGFRRAPVRSVYRRLRWRLHWRLFAARPFEVPVDGMTLRLASSSASSGVYLGDGASDASVARPFREFLKPGMVALDCGAHIGEYTLLFARLVGAAGEVHAFEPDPRIFPYLERNVSQNGLANVRVQNVAVSDHVGREAYAVQPDGTTSSLARWAEVVTGGTVEVETTTLDDYARTNAMPRVDAVKIDVEGAEASVLAGAAGLLEHSRPGLVFVECHSPGAAAEVRRTLEAARYAIEGPTHDMLHQHLLARPIA
jgi:FkbM family methyltransferase